METLEPSNVALEEAMDTDENHILSLHLGELTEDVSFDQVEAILSNPRILEVPGAPRQIAGILLLAGKFVAVRYPMNGVSPADCSCVAIIRRQDGDLYGIAADHITGGGQLDTFYR